METVRQKSSIRSNVRFITNRLNFGQDGVASDIPKTIITSYTKGDPKAFSSVADDIKVYKVMYHRWFFKCIASLLIAKCYLKRNIKK